MFKILTSLVYIHHLGMCSKYTNGNFEIFWHAYLGKFVFW